MAKLLTLALATLLVGCLDEQAKQIEIVGGIVTIDKASAELISVETVACDPVPAEQNVCCALGTTEEQHACVAAQAPEGACISVVCFALCELTRLHGCNLKETP